MRTTRKSVYDREHRYTIEHRRDPAYPGMTPEPARSTTVAGTCNIPAPRSWRECAERVHHDLVREMAHALPGRRLTRIVGWGDQTDAWMACNDGPDGNGVWWIPYDAQRAARDLESARQARQGRGGPRWQHCAGQAVRAVVAAAAFVLAAAMALELLNSARAPDQTRLMIGLMAAAAAVVFIGAAAVFVRRRNLTNNRR